MGPGALLSAGASRCAGGAGPALDVLWGEARFRAAAADQEQVELARVDLQWRVECTAGRILRRCLRRMRSGSQGGLRYFDIQSKIIVGVVKMSSFNTISNRAFVFFAWGAARVARLCSSRAPAGYCDASRANRLQEAFHIFPLHRPSLCVQNVNKLSYV